MLKKLVKRVLMIGAFVGLLGVTTIAGIVLWDLPPKSVREYMSLRMEWDQANGKRLSRDDRLAQDRQFVERTLLLAAKYPETPVEIAALLMADDRARRLSERGPISEKLRLRLA